MSFSKPGVFEKDGDSEWRLLEPPELTGYAIDTLWGKTKDDVWATVNRPGAARIAHYVRGTWTVPDTDGSGFAGSASDDVWSQRDGMVHWDGKTLREYPVPDTKARTHRIAVRSPTDAMAVGDRGIALRWNGTAWSALPSVSNYSLNGVFVTPSGRYRAL